ncbi:helix-turn-helix domain-containing protein [Humitalea sp. 24SJ18S-53]|uniref:helix-turn-helix domain-containing protein n=1 Tax=Humitalea sp. 24SJ18S-53 TaxID=3422307 RepID=UPI003D674264
MKDIAGRAKGRPRRSAQLPAQTPAPQEEAPRRGVMGPGNQRGPTDTRLQAETNELLMTIGARLRALRIERGLTLHALAEQTGLSSSMLSLLERGKTGPSIGTLVVIGSALGTQMSDLLGQPIAAPPEPVSRFASQPVYATADGVRRRILKSDATHGIEIAMNEYSPGTANAPRPVAHDGYEFGIALEGNLEITLGGQVYTLGEGDLVAYRSTDPHRIANPGKRRARALWVNLKQA